MVQSQPEFKSTAPRFELMQNWCVSDFSAAAVKVLEFPAGQRKPVFSSHQLCLVQLLQIRTKAHASQIALEVCLCLEGIWRLLLYNMVEKPSISIFFSQ